MAFHSLLKLKLQIKSKYSGYYFSLSHSIIIDVAVLQITNAFY